MTGGSLPAQTWHDIMVAAHQGVEIKEIAGIGAGQKIASPVAAAANVASSAPDAKPGPPPVLTKRGADILVRVEKMLDEAGKIAGKTSSGEGIKPLSSDTIAFPDSFASATSAGPAAASPRKN
jgi:penicillin-binding protein 1A